MAYFDEWPHVNLYRENDDWALNLVRDTAEHLKDFIKINTIKYADPVEWNITSQYEANTVVIDAVTGDAYLSTSPVPSGVALSTTDYWTPIFNYSRAISILRQQIAAADEGIYHTASAPRKAGDLVWVAGLLYEVTVPMIAGDSYVEGSNCSKVTIEEIIKKNHDAIIEAITTESNAREAADNALSDRLDNVEGTLSGRPFINVKEYGAKGDGVTDDFQAFWDAVNAAKPGTTILIPYGEYFLSQNPDGGTRRVTWKADAGTTFKGPGIGDPGNGDGKFGCTDISNPWITVSGTDEKVDITNVVSPRGGGVYANASEMIADESEPLTITGTLTNGSAVIKNITSTEAIEIGYGVIPSPAISGFADGSSVSNTMRVISKDAHSIVVGMDRGGGVGAFSPTNFTGTSGTYTFKIRKRIWQGIRFEGLNTGKTDNRDAWSWVYNSVVNLHKQPAFQAELDFNIWDTASEVSRCLALTGIGTGHSSVIALEINRGGSCNWSYGIQIGQANVGLDIGAGQPIYVRTAWQNNIAGEVQPISYGIMFDNISTNLMARPLIAGKQIENGAQGIVLQRFTDSAPTGDMIVCKGSDGGDFFSVKANGYTVVQGLQILEEAKTGANLAPTKYLTITDGNGGHYKLLLAD